jgi:DNA-binding XRE family transcriptional regulator
MSKLVASNCKGRYDMGIGKPRTKLGKWIDNRGIKQSWLEEKSGYSKNTITALCNNPDYMPNLQTVQKIIKALQEVDPSVRASQFWDL